MNDELRPLLEKIKRFREERDWGQFHNHKDMAISIVLEAAELLEYFQWKSNAELAAVAEKQREGLMDEIADVFIYLLELADNLGIDVFQAAEAKIQKNEKKYPVEKLKSHLKILNSYHFQRVNILFYQKDRWLLSVVNILR